MSFYVDQSINSFRTCKTTEYLVVGKVKNDVEIWGVCMRVDCVRLDSLWNRQPQHQSVRQVQNSVITVNY